MKRKLALFMLLAILLASTYVNVSARTHVEEGKDTRASQLRERAIRLLDLDAGDKKYVEPWLLPGKANATISPTNGALAGNVSGLNVSPGDKVYYRFYALHSWKARVQGVADEDYNSSGEWRVTWRMGQGSYSVGFTLAGGGDSATLRVKGKTKSFVERFTTNTSIPYKEVIDISKDGYPKQSYVLSYEASVSDDTLDWTLSYSLEKLTIEAKVIQVDRPVWLIATVGVQVFIFYAISKNGTAPPPQPSPPPPGFLHVNATLYTPYKQTVKVGGNYVWVPEKIEFQPSYDWQTKTYVLEADSLAYVPNTSSVVWSRSGSMWYYPKSVWGPRLSGDYIVYVKFTSYSKDMALAVVKEDITNAVVTVPVMRRFNNVYKGYGYVHVHLDNEKVGIYKWKKGILSYTFKIYPALPVYFDYWEMDNGTYTWSYPGRKIAVELGSGQEVWANAVYTAGQPAELIVGTNVNGSVRISGRVDDTYYAFTVSSGQNWNYMALRGFNYTLKAPSRVLVIDSFDVLRGRASGTQFTDSSGENYTGLYNITLTLKAYAAQREVNVYLYAVNGTGQRLLGWWSRSYWTSWSIRLVNVQLDGDRLRLVFNTSFFLDEFRFDYNLKLENSSYLTFKMWLLNNTPLYGTEIQGTVPRGQTIYLKAIYGRRNDTYAGPVLPGTLVLPIDLSAGLHYAYGDFMVRVINYTSTYLLPLPATINCSSEYRVEGRRFVRMEEFHTLPRVGSKQNFFIMFESPRSADGLGERKLCIDGQCFIYNVTRLVISIERVEYNRTHFTIRLKPEYECCPLAPLREHLVYVFHVARRDVRWELGSFVESMEDTPVIVVPYSRFQFLEPVKYRIYARFSLSGPVPLQVTPLFTLYYGSVKPLAWDDSRGYIVFSKPYIWRADKDFDPMPWNGSPGEVWVYVEKWKEWFRAGWNGTNFIADIGRPTWNLRVRIMWVPPDLEDTSILIIPLVQRW